jgi:hypothetical protein
MNLPRLALATVALLVGSSVIAISPVNGHWWNPAESGSGYNIDIRNNVLVLTIYSYKPTGEAQWYLASGAMSPDGRQFTGTLDMYTGGQCISCAYHGGPAYAGNAGTIAIYFTTETSATLNLPGGRVTTIQPFFAALGAGSRLDGTYSLKRATIDYLDGSFIDTSDGSIAAGGTLVIAGNQIAETLTATVNGTTVTLSQSGTFVDHGSYIVITQNGSATRVAVIVRSGAILALQLLAEAQGTTPAFAEVDQWELVDRPAAAKARTTQAATAQSLPLVGALGAVFAGYAPR